MVLPFFFFTKGNSFRIPSNLGMSFPGIPPVENRWSTIYINKIKIKCCSFGNHIT